MSLNFNPDKNSGSKRVKQMKQNIKLIQAHSLGEYELCVHDNEWLKNFTKQSKQDIRSKQCLACGAIQYDRYTLSTIDSPTNPTRKIALYEKVRYVVEKGKTFYRGNILSKKFGLFIKVRLYSHPSIFEYSYNDSGELELFDMGREIFYAFQGWKNKMKSKSIWKKHDDSIEYIAHETKGERRSVHWLKKDVPNPIMYSKKNNPQSNSFIVL